MEIKHQLYLSMIWDRLDIAEEKIFLNGEQLEQVRFGGNDAYKF